MHMRILRLGFAIATMFAIASCKKLPSFDNLSSDFVVITQYDKNANFSSYHTFAIRDTIQVYTGNPDDSIWYDANAQSILNTIRTNMKAFGYTEVTKDQSPDLAIMSTGIRNVTVFAIPPGWWWGYPGWGSPCYWGWCGGWGYWYPYYYTVTVTTGSFITEMIDLKNANAAHKLNVVWSAQGTGQIGSSTSFIVDQCIKTVNQAFVQSPYLKGGQ
ncbi:MAG: DUF4136 domain-containing protein [Bacteroidetes bacterium]|nr:MAG: DUF4136 domain-containing protein [Bacteroidota bacterium]